MNSSTFSSEVGLRPSSYLVVFCTISLLLLSPLAASALFLFRAGELSSPCSHNFVLSEAQIAKIPGFRAAVLTSKEVLSRRLLASRKAWAARSRLTTTEYFD